MIAEKLTLKDLQALSPFKKTYTAETKEEYFGQIRSMSLKELQEHCRAHSLRPIVERPRLEKSLVEAFVKAKAIFDMSTRGLSSGSTLPSNMTKEKREQVLKISKKYK